MTCDQVHPLLAAYADGASSEAERAAIAAHLTGCDRCRRELAVQRVTRSALARHGRATAPMSPPGLATRIAATLAAERAPELTPGWRLRLSAFAAAAIVVLALGAIAVPVITGRSAVVLAAQLALDHLKCFVIEPHDHGEAVTVAEAERELEHDYGWTLTVPPTAGAPGGRLVAVRRCLYGDGRAAHLLYDVVGKPVSLFILPGVERPAEQLSLLGHDEVVWSQGGRTYMLVGQAGLGPQLQAMASNLRHGAE